MFKCWAQVSRYIPLAMLCILCACSPQSKKCLELQKHDPKAKVIELLGQPDDIDSRHEIVAWEYHQNVFHSCNISVLLKDDHVYYMFCDDGKRDVCIE